MKKYVILILCLVTILFAEYKPGDQVPDMEWVDSFGVTHSISELNNQGKAIYLFFGHAGCGWCKVAAPYMNTFWEENKDKNNLYILALTDWNTVSPAATNYTMPVWSGLSGVEGNYTNEYVPYFAVIGNNRTLIYGGNSYNEALDVYDEALETYLLSLRVKSYPGLNTAINSITRIPISNLFEQTNDDEFNVEVSSISPNNSSISVSIEGSDVLINTGDKEELISLVLTATDTDESVVSKFEVFAKKDILPVIYNQIDEISSDMVNSQIYEEEYSEYNSWAADDIVVPSGKSWSVKEIAVVGTKAKDNLASFDSFNVEVYGNSGFGPSNEILFEDSSIIPSIGAGGTYYLSLSKTLNLSTGTYWLCVRANKGYEESGKWKWYCKKNPRIGQEFKYKDNQALGAPSWNYASDLNYNHHDLAFALMEGNETNMNNVITKSSVTLDNYPNPFNPVTSIKFNLVKDQDVELIVFDLAGNIVAELLNERLKSGDHIKEFYAGNLSSGIYILRLKADNQLLKVRKITLIK